MIGAAGDVGQGIVRAGLSRGWNVVAAGRDGQKLEAAFGAPRNDSLRLCTGDVSSEAGALALWEAANAQPFTVDAVVVTVNAPLRMANLDQWSSGELSDLLAANLLTHFNVANVMLPRLPESGILVGIGGGMADIVFPGMVPVAVAQAGLRMLYRGLSRERTGGAQIRELMIVSMVNGASKRDKARPEWVTDDDVGRHACAIIAAPDQFPQAVLQLRTRDQVGKSEQSSQER